MEQVSEQYVERYGRTGVAQMSVAIHRRTAHIHAHTVGVYGTECFLGARERVINGEVMGFHLVVAG